MGDGRHMLVSDDGRNSNSNHMSSRGVRRGCCVESVEARDEPAIQHDSARRVGDCVTNAMSGDRTKLADGSTTGHSGISQAEDIIVATRPPLAL